MRIAIIDLDKVEELYCNLTGSTLRWINEVDLISVIMSRPNLYEPKTGKWIEKEYFFEGGSTKCSCCGKRDYVVGRDNGHGGYDFTFHDFCPHCGAKMTEGKE